MFKLFSKHYLFVLLALLSLSTMNSLRAEDCCYPCERNRFYIGGFGGGIYSNSPNLRQTGLAFFPEDSIGPLAVDARGRSRRNSSGYGGVQVGYEWLKRPLNIGCCSDWRITTGAEVEAFFYRHTKKGDLINPTVSLPEHDFQNKFPMNVGVYLANGIFTLRSCCLGKFAPYVGGGIGAAHLSIRNATATQIDPPEVGVNHFNSKRSDSTWAFAALAKAGLRYNIFSCFNIFAEYRFLYVDSSRYNFGSTMYPDHVPTTTWNVDVSHLCYNAFAVGIQFSL